MEAMPNQHQSNFHSYHTKKYQTPPTLSMGRMHGLSSRSSTPHSLTHSVRIDHVVTGTVHADGAPDRHTHVT